MYRFLLTPRWLGFAALALAMAMAMVLLGNWQLSRYHTRAAINDRIEAADRTAPAPLDTVLDAPGTAGQPPADVAWRKVTVTGRYDAANEIVARGRTVNGRVGFEVVTPLVLADGSAVLVDRGWVPPAVGGAIAAPAVPAAPTGRVTVVGQVHLSESRPRPLERRDGRIQVRRIAVPQVAAELPYPVYGAYLLLDTQTPPNDSAFTPIPIEPEAAWQNAGYVVQWWMFALLTLVGFGWIARREAHGPPRRDVDRLGGTDRAASASPAT